MSKASYHGSAGYVPSFGSGEPVRGRRGGGNMAPPGMQKNDYMAQLKQQMQARVS